MLLETNLVKEGDAKPTCSARYEGKLENDEDTWEAPYYISSQVSATCK